MLRNRWFLSILFLFALTCGNLKANSLYLLSAGDFEDELVGEFARLGSDRIISLFVENLPAGSLVLYNDDRPTDGSSPRWSGPDLEASTNHASDLIQAIQDCPAGPEDAIFVFWFGQSAPPTIDRLLLFSTDGEDSGLPRSELVTALKRKKVRLAGLMTEAGSKWKVRKLKKAPDLTAGHEKIAPCLANLIFLDRGFLDINSLERKETANLLPIFGGALPLGLEKALTESDPTATWRTVLLKIDHYVVNDLKFHQQLDVNSIPRRPDDSAESAETANQETAESTDSAENQETDAQEPEEPQPRSRRHHSRKRDSQKFDWDVYAEEYRNSESIRSEPYPSNYDDFRDENRTYGESGFADPVPGWSGGNRNWSAPIYHPEAGDILLGINGVPIFHYSDFLDEIQESSQVIYLTLADQYTGAIYELRTMMGPAIPNRVRLGLSVANNYFGGVRITGTALGTPASRCQYRLGFQYGPLYDIPSVRPHHVIPVPVPEPIPDPIPGPLWNSDSADSEPAPSDGDSPEPDESDE